MEFGTAEDFLLHYSDSVPEGMLFCRTKAEFQAYENVLLEVSIPGVPNHLLLRAQVVHAKADRGAWLRFSSDDTANVEFLVGVAKGELEGSDTQSRTAARFPTNLPVDCRLGSASSTEACLVDCTEDISTHGAFVRSPSPPQVGTQVSLEIGPLPVSGECLRLDGKVAWVRSDIDEEAGFGVRFDRGQTRELRTYMRRARETGRFQLAREL
jgi:Tfp pilus assembly protein PilZ